MVLLLLVVFRRFTVVPCLSRSFSFRNTSANATGYRYSKRVVIWRILCCGLQFHDPHKALPRRVTFKCNGHCSPGGQREELHNAAATNTPRWVTAIQTRQSSTHEQVTSLQQQQQMHNVTLTDERKLRIPDPCCRCRNHRNPFHPKRHSDRKWRTLQVRATAPRDSRQKQ